MQRIRSSEYTLSRYPGREQSEQNLNRAPHSSEIFVIILNETRVYKTYKNRHKSTSHIKWWTYVNDVCNQHIQRNELTWTMFAIARISTSHTRQWTYMNDVCNRHINVWTYVNDVCVSAYRRHTQVMNLHEQCLQSAIKSTYIDTDVLQSTCQRMHVRRTMFCIKICIWYAVTWTMYVHECRAMSRYDIQNDALQST